MSEQIECGDGWRLLGPDEVVGDGDEVLFPFTGWGQARDVGNHAGRFTYRRRLPAKPEALEIDHQTITCNSFDEVMAKDDSGEVWRLVSNTEQARQLADWLTRYADWREAQESVAKTPPN